MNSTAKRPPEAYHSPELFEQGMGYLLFSRFRSGGRVEAGVFLLDVYCLGVKNAFYTEIHEVRYQSDLLDRVFPGGHVSIEPACARKLVQGAIAYARNLGLEPHSDYKKAARVLGGISPDDCARNFTYGHEGKPLYIQGPHDSQERANRIMKLLHARCGEGNYHFMLVTSPPPDFFGEP